MHNHGLLRYLTSQNPQYLALWIKIFEHCGSEMTDSTLAFFGGLTKRLICILFTSSTLWVKYPFLYNLPEIALASLLLK